VSEPLKASVASTVTAGTKAEPKMLLHAQCGRRHYPTDDIAANVADYKSAFGLPADVALIGKVHREFDATRQPIDKGEPIAVALASAKELAAKAVAPKREATEP
jgi:hypothetical protein